MTRQPSVRGVSLVMVRALRLRSGPRSGGPVLDTDDAERAEKAQEYQHQRGEGWAPQACNELQETHSRTLLSGWRGKRKHLHYIILWA